MERGVLVQRSMGPRHTIIGGISAKDPGQVGCAKRDHVVETFAADRADESLNVSILPGRSGCDRMVPNAIARIRCKKTGPYEVSRSRMRYRGASDRHYLIGFVEIVVGHFPSPPATSTP